MPSITHVELLYQAFAHCTIFSAVALLKRSGLLFYSNVADQYFYSAKDLRLGKPFPHLLPNLAKAILFTPFGLSKVITNFFISFFQSLKKVYSLVLLTFTLLTFFGTYNSHASYILLALILSQNQTLLLMKNSF